MDLETWFQIHTNVSNFEMASPKTIQMLKKLLIFVTLQNHVISYRFHETELKSTIFLNFQVYHRNAKHFESLYGFGGRHLKIRDIFMDLEPCFKEHNLVVIQLNNTKLGRMTNFKVVFQMMVLFYKFDKIGNSTQSPAQPQIQNFACRKKNGTVL